MTDFTKRVSARKVTERWERVVLDGETWMRFLDGFMLPLPEGTEGEERKEGFVWERR